MSWWIWVPIILILLVIVIGLFSDEKTPSSNEKSKNLASDKSAQDIADEVTTIAQFKALERKVDRADEKRQKIHSYNRQSLKAEEKADDEYNILQDALDIASNKILRWQFIPNADLETPLSIIQNSYKVFSTSEYEEKMHELGNNEEEWYVLRGDDEPDEKDEETKFIIKFRKIVESQELSDDEISKKINSLVSRNKEVARDFFDIEGNLKPAEQWRETKS